MAGLVMQSDFAFLVHPRNTLRADMGILFGRPFSLVPEVVWRTALKHLPVPPMVTGKLSRVDVPGVVVGRIITVPLTPTQLLTLPRMQVQARISSAIDMARDRGASVVGLGALTAPASVGGKIFAKRQDIGVTNGNAFTAAMTMQAMERLSAPLGNDPLIAIVGATGSVGSCLTRLYARKHPGRLLLVARNERRLLALASDVRRDGVEVRVSTDMVEVSKADLVVLLTSSPDAVLRSEHLKPGAIVLDDTVPRNTDAKLLSQRPDVLIVDGGLVEIPGFDLRGSIALAPKLAYACLAETMLLALAGHKGHFCMGEARIDQAEYILKLAVEHQHLGFHLAPFRSFGKLIQETTSRSFAAPVEEFVSCAA
jgi:fatty aldehyde-generating acyl-ACP reductase